MAINGALEATEGAWDLAAATSGTFGEGDVPKVDLSSICDQRGLWGRQKQLDMLEKERENVFSLFFSRRQCRKPLKLKRGERVLSGSLNVSISCHLY